MDYTIEKSLILASTSEGNKYVGEEFSDDLAIADGREDKFYLLYRASDFDADRKAAFDDWEYLNRADCPTSHGDGHVGCVKIAVVKLDCGDRFIVFEETQSFGSNFEPASAWDAETNSNAAKGQID